MDAKDYTIRCDKCQFKPYVYCEMCMIRTHLQSCVETVRKDIRNLVASDNIANRELHDRLDKQSEQIKELQDAISKRKSSKD